VKTQILVDLTDRQVKGLAANIKAGNRSHAAIIRNALQIHVSRCEQLLAVDVLGI
jgi:hypothetical protein